MARGCSPERLAKILLEAGCSILRAKTGEGCVTFYVARDGEECALSIDNDKWKKFVEDEKKAKQQRRSSK